jgi:hypothetical protein
LGTWYQIDSQRVYNELKTLVYDSSLWLFVQCFERTQNGRGAWLALVVQSEGRANNNLRKNKAYANSGLAAAVHQKAHNELLELNEVVSETKKVTDFLARISAPETNTAKQVVMGDEVRLDYFELTQTYLTNFANAKQTQNNAGHSVSKFQYTAGKGRGGKNNNGKISGTGRIHARTYTPQKWNALSIAEREEVGVLREKNPTKKQKGNHKQGKGINKLQKESVKLRKAAAAVATVASETDDSAQHNENKVVDQAAGYQFGPTAHGKTK